MNTYTDEEFFVVRDEINRFIEYMGRTIQCLRSQEISKAMNLLQGFPDRLERLIEKAYKSDIMNYVLNSYIEVQNALNQKDYILAADYIELGMSRELIRWLEQMIPEYGWYWSKANFSNRMERIDWESAGKKVEDFPAPSREEWEETGCFPELTSSGGITLAKQNEGGEKVYFHSNLSPGIQGFDLARNYISDTAKRYVVFGLGMGYHIRALAIEEPGVVIDVYEPDDMVLRLACGLVGDIGIYVNPFIRIHYDPTGQLFAEAAMKKEQETWNEVKICFHEPTIFSLPEGSFKQKMQNLFLEQDNEQRWGRIMNRNFAWNRERVFHIVDELEPKFEGKTIYLIAGGPSLEKNMEALKRKSEDDIIFSVARSFRFLLQHEIRPDYVILTDPKPSCISQMKEIASETVPLLLLSTAWQLVAQRYEGEKYLIYQKEFEAAQSAAKETDSMLFETGGSVVTTALDICIRFACKRIVFVGLDLAFTGGKLHFGLKVEQSEKQTGSITVEDVFGNSVQTSKNLNMYRLWIEERIERAKEDGCASEFIDASEGGAKVAGTKIMTLADVIEKSGE